MVPQGAKNLVCALMQQCHRRVVPQEQLMPEALRVAKQIASCSAPAVAKAKDCIKRGLEVPLSEGLQYEM